MKIAVSATGDRIDAPFDGRFGRCTYLIFVDSETSEWQAVRNEAAGATGGAGIQAAETVAREGATVVITGHLGPNAFRVLSAAHIRPLTTAASTVREAIESFKAGNISELTSPNSPGHAGQASGGSGHAFGRVT